MVSVVLQGKVDKVSKQQACKKQASQALVGEANTATLQVIVVPDLHVGNKLTDFLLVSHYDAKIPYANLMVAMPTGVVQYMW